MPETSTNISDSIIEMYNIAAAVLHAPNGMLTDWEENLLCTFIQMYWSDDQVNGENE
jgi:hypothetical protein